MPRRVCLVIAIFFVAFVWHNIVATIVQNYYTKEKRRTMMELWLAIVLTILSLSVRGGL